MVRVLAGSLPYICLEAKKGRMPDQRMYHAPTQRTYYTPSLPASIDPQDEVVTEELAPIRESPRPAPLVDAWLKALQAAEALHACLHPTYPRHSEPELMAFVHAALHGRRDPSKLVPELLAQGMRNVKQPRLA
jgi:hypothetical protein